MHPFDHFTPESLPEALETLSRQNGQARVIAGGTDLMLQMKSGAVRPAAVVNIKRLPELQGLTYSPAAAGPPPRLGGRGGGLQMGALTTLRELTRSPIIREHYPCLAHAASLMASEQIRSFATVGGNLCNASPSADLAPPLIALGAMVHLASPGGQRQLPLEKFFLGPGQSALAHGELLRTISVPLPRGETIYIKHTPRALMDIAVVGVAVRLELAGEYPAGGYPVGDGGRIPVCRAARIVLGAVAPVPLRARRAEAELTGHPLTPERIAQAARVAAEECSPIDDVRGSAWYRQRMVSVLLKRGLAELAG